MNPSLSTGPLPLPRSSAHVRNVYTCTYCKIWTTEAIHVHAVQHPRDSPNHNGDTNRVFGTAKLMSSIY